MKVEKVLKMIVYDYMIQLDKSTLKNLGITLKNSPKRIVCIQPGANRAKVKLALMIWLLFLAFLVYVFFVTNEIEINLFGFLVRLVIYIVAFLGFINYSLFSILNFVQIGPEQVVAQSISILNYSRKTFKHKEINSLITNYSKGMKHKLKLIINLVSGESISLPIFLAKPPYSEDAIRQIERYFHEILEKESS